MHESGNTCISSLDYWDKQLFLSLKTEAEDLEICHISLVYNRTMRSVSILSTDIDCNELDHELVSVLLYFWIIFNHLDIILSCLTEEIDKWHIPVDWALMVVEAKKKKSNIGLA